MSPEAASTDLIRRVISEHVERRSRLRSLAEADAERLLAVDLALNRMRTGSDTQQLLTLAAVALRAATGLSRSLVCGVVNGRLEPVAAATPDHGGAILALAQRGQLTLEPGILETEVLRKRVGMVADAATLESRSLRPLVPAAHSSEYLVVPVTIDDEVVALLFADDGPRGRALTARDLEAARLFADSVAMIISSAAIHLRLDEQRDELDATLLAAESMIRRMRESRVEIAPSLARPTIGLRSDSARITPIVPTGNARFTTRERDVLELLARGYTNLQVADRLTVTNSTVKSHVKHIFKKLGASTRAEAIARYRRSYGDALDVRAS
jgi:DNA-binding CsgD family transcriptional regulator/GAF domain-containing protein